MSKPGERKIPRSVIGRFPQYLWETQELRDEGQEWVSSQALADALGFTSSTVRQDLSHLDFSGVAKRGYEAAKLQQVLSEFLGLDAGRRAVIMGAGNLGRALAQHNAFARQGFVIRAIFDNNPKLVGRKIGQLVVQDARDLEAAVRSEKIDIGMIAVPAQAAQAVADSLVAAGVRGILNLAPTNIRVPKPAVVRNARISAGLMELSGAMKMASQA